MFEVNAGSVFSQIKPRTPNVRLKRTASDLGFVMSDSSLDERLSLMVSWSQPCGHLALSVRLLSCQNYGVQQMSSAVSTNRLLQTAAVLQVSSRMMQPMIDFFVSRFGFIVESEPGTGPRWADDNVELYVRFSQPASNQGVGVIPLG